MARPGQRVRPKKPTKLYIAEWLAVRGMDRHDLAAALDVAQETVFRWIDGTRSPSSGTARAIEEELTLAPGDLARHPDQGESRSLLGGLSERAKRDVLEFIEFQRRKGRGE